uniref:Uncharacterized protein n=1 Tax=Rhizophora mucronata TaxID=61149 RepID=A0A2P2KTM4_RHIMU
MYRRFAMFPSLESNLQIFHTRNLIMRNHISSKGLPLFPITVYARMKDVDKAMEPRSKSTDI